MFEPSYIPLETSHQIKAFISSKDILDDERSTAENVLKSLNIQPIRVETNKWMATTNSLEYLKQVEKSDIVILLVNLLSDSQEENYYNFVKEEIDTAFRLGKPILAFFKDTSGNAIITNKFISETQLKLFHFRFRNCVELAIALRNSVYNELFRKYDDSPKIISTKIGLYEETNKLINNTCKYRLYLSQYTPTFLLGARKRRTYETNLLDSLKSFIARCDSGCEIALLYNKQATRSELESGEKGEYDINSINDNISFFNEQIDRTPKLYVVCSESDTLPFVVCDHTYILGSSVKNASLSVLDENPKIASELVKQVENLKSGERGYGISEFRKLIEKSSLNS